MNGQSSKDLSKLSNVKNDYAAFRQSQYYEFLGILAIG